MKSSNCKEQPSDQAANMNVPIIFCNSNSQQIQMSANNFNKTTGAQAKHFASKNIGNSIKSQSNKAGLAEE